MSFSPDQAQNPQETRLSQENKNQLIERTVESIEKIVSEYERLYIPSERLARYAGAPFTKERFEQFKQWIDTLSQEETVLTRWKLNQTKLEKDVLKLERLYRVLLDVRTNKFPASKIIWNPPERPLIPGEFFLGEHDILSWNKLPATTVMKRECVLDWIQYTQFKEDRPIVDLNETDDVPLAEREDLRIVDQDLREVGYAIDNPDKRRRFLESIAPKGAAEEPTTARLLSVGDLIRGKTGKQWLWTDSRTTGELFELLDEEGVRPATLLELLVYSKTRWKPVRGKKAYSLSSLERLEGASADIIYALGSIFSDSEHGRCFSLLHATGQRELESVPREMQWKPMDRLLVFRKHQPHFDPIDQFLKTC